MMDNSIFDIMKSSGILPGMIVVSVAGHDEGRVYLVVSRSDKMVRVADGRARPAGNAKIKRVTHLKALGMAEGSGDLLKMLAGMANEEEKNISIRNSINCFFEKDEQSQGEVEHV
ncbi:MAG: hypothetical protein ACYC5K_00835 [Saccharofermentanales bacterium]